VQDVRRQSRQAETTRAPERSVVRAVAYTLGLAGWPPVYRDPQFYVAMLAGVGFWVGLWLCVPVHPITPGQVLSHAFLVLVVWYPVLEEGLFRGYLQGQLSQQSWGQQHWRGITAANGCTSLLFVLGHFWSHPPLWAAAVLLPSLVFGYFRDRHTSVYPCMVLHAFYNAGYFGLTGLP
jgi:membrane protease YdiL (CAAX protease family)